MPASRPRMARAFADDGAPGIVCPFEYHDSLVTAFRLAPVAEANLINYLWPLLLVLPGTSV
ncbi:hypothetical protein P3T21_001566 [Paraburkholderia sp. GAS334]